MPSRIEITHLRHHLVDWDAGDAARIKQRAALVVDILDAAPTDGQDILDYVEAQLNLSISPRRNEILPAILAIRARGNYHPTRLADYVEHQDLTRLG